MDGPFEETFGTGWQAVGGRSLVVRPGCEPHANRYTGRTPSRTLTIELLPRAFSEIEAETRVLGTPSHLQSPHFAVLGRRLDLECRNPDNVSSLAIEAHVSELIVSMTRQAHRWTGGEPRWLNRVREYLHSEFTRSISLADLATIARVYPSHLAKAFRRSHGRTIGEYVRQLRVEHGAMLLKQRQLPLADIAIACGFHDQSHFTRVFAKAFGMSPGRYASVIGRR